MGSFVGNVSEGGACNCETLTFNPHGNGTHTEGVGHISPGKISVNQCLKKYFFAARLVSITPEKLENGDSLITVSQIKSLLGNSKGFQALIIRTLPNSDNKLYARYSGFNPCYLEPEATRVIEEYGIDHLLIDLPSVDKEEDGGLLEAHKRFWTYPENPRMNATITELIYVPNSAADGFYLLNLQVAAIESDASPSRPVIFPLLQI